jgi:predicted nucleic acid-binding protein
MNQLFQYQESKDLPLKHAMQEVDNVSRAFWKHDRKINAAKREILIFMNASKRIKDMDIDKVSIEYLQEALQSVLGELEK